MPDRQAFESPELLMPVSDSAAALQFFVEAMKQNTAVLKGVQAEQRETLRMVQDTRERVIRLESGNHAETVASLQREIETLKGEVDALQSDRDKRAGAVSLFEWVFKHWPAVIGFAFLVAIVLRSTGKLQ